MMDPAVAARVYVRAAPCDRLRAKRRPGRSTGSADGTESDPVSHESALLDELVRDLLDSAKHGLLDGLWSYELESRQLTIRVPDDPSADVTISGETWSGRIGKADRTAFARALAAHARGMTKKIVCEFRLDRHDGTSAWLHASGKIAARNGHNRPRRLIGTFLDITTRKAEEMRIAHAALHDPLTGLPNRTLFDSRLQREIALARRKGGVFAVLACDLDRFKQVNDRLGHQAGDALLKVVSQRMRDIIREGDTLARLGGDEFGVVLHALADPFEAGAIAERIIAAVTRPVSLAGQDVVVGASIGVSVASTRDDPDPRQACRALEQADIALYASKSGGRNRFTYFDGAMDAKVKTRTRMAEDLSRAVARNEMALHFQPIVDARSGEICAYEALMRWQHREQGTLLPGMFIPLAEETGAMDALGTWAIAQACREAAAATIHRRVSVNVSAVQFRSPPTLMRSVSRSLAETGLHASYLELEVNEGVLEEDADNVLACLSQLQATGVRVALDDFGTGRSSLSRLRSLPFDTIKIDGTLIKDLACTATEAVVRAIIGLATSFGASVVAEGVETPEQLAWVRQAGCGRYQGFLAGVPTAAT